MIDAKFNNEEKKALDSTLLNEVKGMNFEAREKRLEQESNYDPF